MILHLTPEDNLKSVYILMLFDRMRQPKGGYGSNRRSYSPKVRQNRKGAKKYSTRDLMADQDVFDYESGEWNFIF